MKSRFLSILIIILGIFSAFQALAADATTTIPEAKTMSLVFVSGIALFLVGAAQYQHFFKDV